MSPPHERSRAHRTVLLVLKAAKRRACGVCRRASIFPLVDAQNTTAAGDVCAHAVPFLFLSFNRQSVVVVHGQTTFSAQQVILWDKIVESAEGAHLLEQDMTVKYGLIDEVRKN